MDIRRTFSHFQTKRIKQIMYIATKYFKATNFPFTFLPWIDIDMNYILPSKNDLTLLNSSYILLPEEKTNCELNDDLKMSSIFDVM